MEIRNNRIRVIAGLVPTLITISIFGPRLNELLRIEHVAIYGAAILLPLLLLYSIASQRLPDSSPIVLPIPLVQVFTILVLITAWTAISTLLNPYEPSVLEVIAQAENYVQRIAVVVSIILVLVTTQVTPSRYLQQILLIYLSLLAVNSLLVFAMLFTNIESLVELFVVGPYVADITQTVWWRARAVGRYSGIFGHPATAGLMYSIGLFGLIYMFETRRWTGRFYVGAMLILIAGLLSVSKVYLLIGLPLSVAYVFVLSDIRLTLSRGRVFVAIASTGGAGLIFSSWKGYDRLVTLVRPSVDSLAELIIFYTAGRLASTGVYFTITSEVLAHSAFFGLGFGGVTAFDSGYLEAFSQGGFIALVLYGILIVMLMKAAIAHLELPEGRLLLVLSVFVAIASIGKPVTTANRFAPFLWMVVTMILFSFHESPGKRGLISET